MSTPLWYRLIDRWVPEGMGNTGVTLPFLAGALAHAEGRSSVDLETLHSLLGEIVASPVPGFSVEVRRCPTIRDLVLSVSPVDRTLPFHGCYLSGPNGSPAIGFSQDAQSTFGGLDSSNPSECVSRLIARALEPCAKGTFSRLRSQVTGEFEFGAFSAQEIGYIERHAAHLVEQI